MKYTIYKITNTINQKTYIGKHQTENLDDGYMGSGKYLKIAIEKYGIGNFKKEILFVFDTEEEMNSKEAELVSEEFVSWSNTYNICVGGQGGFSHIRSMPSYKESCSAGGRRGKQGQIKFYETNPERYQEFRKTSREKILDFNRNRNRESFKTFSGKTHSDEWKRNHSEKMKVLMKGENNSQFGTCWITKDQKNMKIKLDNLDEYVQNGWIRGRV